MKGLSKAKATPGIWMIESRKPEMGTQDICIRIKKTAICGTDIHIYNWDSWSRRTIDIPMIIGHEYVGEIVDIGEEVQGFSIGDRVSGEGHITCGSCRNCRAGRRHLCHKNVGVGVNRQGAFAEYLVIPAFNAFKVPNNISDNIATIFDPLGNAVHTALSFDLTGEDILIVGAGPIGIMAAKICKHVGARHVVLTDLNPYRLKLAQQAGINNTVNILEQNLQDVMGELGMQEGFDIGLEMSGASSSLNTMVEHLTHGGKIALLGIPSEHHESNWAQIILKGLTIKGIYGREMFDTWYKMTSLIQSGLDVSSLITHEFKIKDFQEAFEIMASGKSGKVILDWT